MSNWTIQGKTVEFDDASHTYHVNGIKCISVTQILKFKYPSKYDGISKKILEHASNLGTELHEAIEVYETTGLEREDLQEFRNYKFIKDRFGFEVIENETPILLEYNGLIVCGRLDQIQRLDGKLGIADIKRTATMDKNYLAYQLNMYRLGVQQSYGKKIEFLKAIHLKDSKRKYIDFPINEQATFELLDEYLEKKRGADNE